MVGTQVVIYNMTPTDVRSIVREEVREEFIEGLAKLALAMATADKAAEAAEDFISREQTRKILGVSLTTLQNWAKDTVDRKAILIPLKVGARVRYRRQDVLNALKENRRFKSDKNDRKQDRY